MICPPSPFLIDCNGGLFGRPFFFPPIRPTSKGGGFFFFFFFLGPCDRLVDWVPFYFPLYPIGFFAGRCAIW